MRARSLELQSEGQPFDPSRPLFGAYTPEHLLAALESSPEQLYREVLVNALVGEDMSLESIASALSALPEALPARYEVLRNHLAMLCNLGAETCERLERAGLEGAAGSLDFDAALLITEEVLQQRGDCGDEHTDELDLDSIQTSRSEFEAPSTSPPERLPSVASADRRGIVARAPATGVSPLLTRPGPLALEGRSQLAREPDRSSLSGLPMLGSSSGKREEAALARRAHGPEWIEALPDPGLDSWLTDILGDDLEDLPHEEERPSHIPFPIHEDVRVFAREPVSELDEAQSGEEDLLAPSERSDPTPSLASPSLPPSLRPVPPLLSHRSSERSEPERVPAPSLPGIAPVRESERENPSARARATPAETSLPFESGKGADPPFWRTEAWGRRPVALEVQPFPEPTLEEDPSVSLILSLEGGEPGEEAGFEGMVPPAEVAASKDLTLMSGSVEATRAVPLEPTPEAAARTERIERVPWLDGQDPPSSLRERIADGAGGKVPSGRRVGLLEEPPEGLFVESPSPLEPPLVPIRPPAAVRTSDDTPVWEQLAARQSWTRIHETPVISRRVGFVAEELPAGSEDLESVEAVPTAAFLGIDGAEDDESGQRVFGFVAARVKDVSPPPPPAIDLEEGHGPPPAAGMVLSLLEQAGELSPGELQPWLDFIHETAHAPEAQQEPGMEGFRRLAGYALELQSSLQDAQARVRKADSALSRIQRLEGELEDLREAVTRSGTTLDAAESLLERLFFAEAIDWSEEKEERFPSRPALLGHLARLAESLEAWRTGYEGLETRCGDLEGEQQNLREALEDKDRFISHQDKLLLERDERFTELLHHYERRGAESQQLKILSLWNYLRYSLLDLETRLRIALEPKGLLGKTRLPPPAELKQYVEEFAVIERIRERLVGRLPQDELESLGKRCEFVGRYVKAFRSVLERAGKAQKGQNARAGKNQAGGEAAKAGEGEAAAAPASGPDGASSSDGTGSVGNQGQRPAEGGDEGFSSQSASGTAGNIEPGHPPERRGDAADLPVNADEVERASPVGEPGNSPADGDGMTAHPA